MWHVCHVYTLQVVLPGARLVAAVPDLHARCSSASLVSQWYDKGMHAMVIHCPAAICRWHLEPRKDGHHPAIFSSVANPPACKRY